MAAMFTMMNNARLGVGGQGVGVAEGAFRHALGYALERRQGRSLHGYTIAAHADVRRMLMQMKAETFAARAVALSCAHAIDMQSATGDAAWAARAAFLTPIAKVFGTETGIRVADLGIQVHGGMGFIEETGAAQYLRDVRVTAIYEGTNGIQAMDLVARKMADGGEMAGRLLDEVAAGAEAARETFPDMAEAVWQAERDPARGDRLAGGAGRHQRPFRRCGGVSACLCAGAGRKVPPCRRHGGPGRPARGDGAVLCQPAAARTHRTAGAGAHGVGRSL